MKKLLVLLALCLCMTALFCGCGDTVGTEQTTAAPALQETQPVTEDPTEAGPVYELQTVYLCVQEDMKNYEGGSNRKGYTYDEYGRVKEYFMLNADGSYAWVTEYSYDEQGNNIEMRTGDSVTVMTYDEYGRLTSKLSGYMEYYYVYDEMGFVIEETCIERFSDEVTYSFTMTYNADHTEATIDQFKNGEPNGQTIENYNAAGQVLTSNTYDPNGNWKHGQTWEYDEAGRLMKEYNYSRSETQADYETIYTYDEKGLLLSKNVDYYYGYLLEYTYEPFEILVRVN